MSVTSFTIGELVRTQAWGARRGRGMIHDIQVFRVAMIRDK